MNSFFASCAQQDDPKLRKKPIAVVPMLNIETTAILAASYEAKKFGIKTGTLVGEARRLCPKIQFVKTTSDRYVHYHDRVAEVIESIIPVELVLSIDEFACELKGSQRQNEKALEISQAIKKKIETEVGECLTTSIGVAENVLLAKAASDLQKPNGLVLIDESNREQILSPLSVRALSGVGAQMEKRLNAYGIRTIGDLFKQTEADVKRAWGSVVGERYYQWIRGKNVFRPHEQNKSLGHQHVLEPEKRSLRDATLILKTLLLKGAARLRRKKLYTTRMGVSIDWMGEDTPSFGHSTSFPETQDSLFLIKALDQILADHLPREPKERNRLKPLRVGVTFVGLVKDEEHQASLFEDTDRKNLLSVMDRINEKFGKESVTVASVKDIDAAKDAKIAFNYIPDKKDL